MESNIELTQEAAECIGLWLAEGDTKTTKEITFTNNCLTLVEFFAKTIKQIFKECNIKPRVYVYSAKKDKIKFNFSCKINYYQDKRARKPYFIFRIGSVAFTRQWKELVYKTTKCEKFYKDILRGFFAGEGNLKSGNHSNRTIRIAQGKPNEFVEQIFRYYGITYQYSNRGRAYSITGKWNWDKMAKIKIADLHPIKKEKFWRTYYSYKEIHYPNHHIKNNLVNLLNKPYTTFELSKIFNRSHARIYDILSFLKKKGEVKNFRIRSINYWINARENKIIISKIKEKYLLSLKENRKKSSELANEMDVCWKSAYNRLLELQKLNLVDKDTNGNWRLLNSKKEVIVL